LRKGVGIGTTVGSHQAKKSIENSDRGLLGQRVAKASRASVVLSMAKAEEKKSLQKRGYGSWHGGRREKKIVDQRERLTH